LPRISNTATKQTDLIAQHSVQDGGLRLRLNPPYGLRACSSSAVDQGLLEENPASEVKVREREKGFDAEEAHKILTATLREFDGTDQRGDEGGAALAAVARRLYRGPHQRTHAADGGRLLNRGLLRGRFPHFVFTEAQRAIRHISRPNLEPGMRKK
jgi:hypothetical protein